MTPEETNVLEREVGKLLKAEAEERIEHTKAAVRAAASRPVLF